MTTYYAQRNHEPAPLREQSFLVCFVRAHARFEVLTCLDMNIYIKPIYFITQNIVIKKVYTLSHRERKVLVRVLPHDGYKFEAELKKGTSIKDVIKTLKELGFPYELEDTSHMNIESLQKIYDSFMNLSQKYGTIIRISNGFYREWLKLGFDLIDAKRQVYEENTFSSTSPRNQASNRARDNEKPKEEP